MGKTVFVPLTDDLLYEHPERILGPIIPFSQQARPVTVGHAAFSSKTPVFDTKIEVRNGGENPTSCSKQDNSSALQDGALL